MKPRSNFGTADHPARLPVVLWLQRIPGKAAADLTGKLVTFGVTVAAARTLPGDAFGVVALATVWGWLAGVATDAGWSMYLAQAAARQPAAAGVMAATILGRRGRTALAAWVLVSVAASAWLAPAFIAGFALLLAAQLAGAVLDTAMHAFRGLERTDLEARLHTAQRLAAGTLAVGVLAWRPSLEGLGLALLVPPLGALATARVVLRRLTGNVAATSWSPPRGAEVRQQVWPLGLGALVSAIYFRCDVLFVEYWHGLDAAGVYNAAFRVVDAVRLFPAAVLAVAFPALVRARDAKPVVRVSWPLFIAGAMGGGTIAVLAPVVLELAYGPRLVSAATTLRVLALSVPLFFLNYALTHQVIGWGRPRAYLHVAIGGLTVNLAANSLLVRPYGGTGAALATCLTEVAITAACLAFLARRAPAAASVTGSAA